MKLLKSIVALAGVAIIAFASTACSSEEDNKLYMATEAGFAPYEYYDGEDIVGVDVDIAKEIAKDLGKELVIQNMTFDAVLTAVPAGTCDFGAAGISINDERKETMDFSIEYAQSRQVAVVLENSEITDVKDVVNYQCGVQTGTTAAYYLDDEEVTSIAPKLYNKYFEAIADLNAGRIDAIIMDSLPAESILNTNEGLKVLDGELFIDSYAFAVQKGNTEMVDAINKTMQRLIEEGKIDEFTLNHLGE